VAEGRLFSDETLLNDNLILAFVSHPKAFEHFQEGRQKLKELIGVLVDRASQLTREFPSDSEVELLYQVYLAEFNRYEMLFAYETAVAPFLVFGIADTSTIADPIVARNMHDVQIKVFKNWLANYQIGSKNPHFLKEMREYASHLPVDLFSAVMKAVLNLVYDYNSIIDLYIADDREEYEGNSPDDADDVADDESPANKAIEEFEQKSDLEVDEICNKYFSRDAIISLFLKLTSELS
jgi:hypothetical protein